MDYFEEWGSEEALRAWEMTQRVICRINRSLNRFDDLLTTTHEQQILSKLLEEERNLYRKKRKIVDVIKIPPSVQAVLREFNSLEMQKLALEMRGLNDIGIVTTNSLSAHIHILQRYILSWAIIEFRKRPRLATAVYGREYDLVYAGKWYVYIVLNHK